jgi:hypothetical protein
LSAGVAIGKERAMSTNEQDSGREERLAAKLRENLRRRKAQARGIENAQTLPKDGGDS